MVGKSGTGRNAKHFYYGHKRKMLVEGDRHASRCRFENIPALGLEEAVISRIKEYSNDPDLVTELAAASCSESNAKKEHQKSLIAAREQERRIGTEA